MCVAGETFRGKKITMLGLGLLGRGINVARFLAEHGALLTITDLKTREDLQASLEELKEYPDITYVLGEHRFEDFESADLVIKAAGVPLDSPYIQHARERGILIEMDASLFMKKAPTGVQIIGVTGTRGKSTVTYLIEHILSKVGKKVFLGGNVKGTATLPLLKEVESGDIVVLELDSWQLQGFGDSKISPHIAVFASFMRDHMNYYKGDMQTYFDDKANIFKYQTEKDVLIVSPQAWKEIQKLFDGDIQSHIKVVEEKEIQLSIPGPHNSMNALLAVEAVEALGVGREEALQYAASFEGIPYRLECVREIDGVTYYNDSNATSPDAVIAALNSFPDSHIVLITGGTDKELEFEELAREMNNKKPDLVLLPGTATEKLKLLLEIPYEEVQSMKEAVKSARDRSSQGSVVLLSPGAASFGLFKNEYDRGDQFRAEVTEL